MLETMDQQLFKARSRLRAKQRTEELLEQARTTAYGLKRRCERLRERMKEEKADVDKLEGLGLTALFHTVLGTKADRMEKEQQEFLAARLKHEEAAKSLDAANQDVTRLSDERKAYAEAVPEYERLLDKKERLLASGGGAHAEKLFALSAEVADLEADRVELEEAAQAGKAALMALNKVRAELDSAAGWGTWDMMGGGLMATMAKHGRIDAAKQTAHGAQRLLRKFQDELSDVGERLHVSLQIGGFSKFADYFFDGLIVDWMIQSKIQNASAACRDAISQVQSAMGACARRSKQLDADIAKRAQSRRELIETA